MATKSHTFYFRAMSPEGTSDVGQIAARDQADAVKKLAARGYQPLKVSGEPFVKPFWQREVRFLRPRLSLTECQAFTAEMGILLRAGMEVVDALSSLMTTLPKRGRTFAVCRAARQSVRLGQPFAVALKQTGFSFPAEFLSLISVGEETASLSKSLETLSAAYTDRLKFQKLLFGALAYPVFLLVVAFFVLALLVMFVAPNLAGLFESLDRPMPFVISSMTSVRAFVTQNWFASALVGFLMAVGLVLAATVPLIRQTAVSLAFSMPILGEGLKWSATQRLASTLQLYIARRAPLAIAVSNAFVASGFPNSHAIGARSVDLIRQGKSLSQALSEVSLLPRKVLHIISVGENGGRLDEVLSIVVDEAKTNFERRMSLFSSLLAPVLIVLVGLTVGSVILGVFSALMDINNVAY